MTSGNDHQALLDEDIAKCETSKRIELGNRSLTDQHITIIVENPIIKKHCTSLWLHDNMLTSQSTRVLADSLRNNNILQELFLDGNSILDAGVYHLSLVLNNSSLTSLSLSECGITDVGAMYLAENLKTNQTLRRLWLYHNQIGDQGMQAFAEALTRYNTTLEWLDLRSNKLVTDASVCSLVLMVKSNQSLKKFWMEYCSLSYASKTRLRQLARPKTDFDLGA